MSKSTAILLLGLLVALVPFLGIPPSWDPYLLVPAGLLIAVLGFVLRQRMADVRARRPAPDVFTENGAPRTPSDGSHGTDE